MFCSDRCLNGHVSPLRATSPTYFITSGLGGKCPSTPQPSPPINRCVIYLNSCYFGAMVLLDLTVENNGLYGK